MITRIEQIVLASRREAEHMSNMESIAIFAGITSLAREMRDRPELRESVSRWIGEDNVTEIFRIGLYPTK